ncbi:ABC-2 family transporter protein [Paenibacillus sp. Soil522]|uniref:ABC-2 family transporter protein n=1 Tax=Paenibacillus sp. Soil522 TaxID=1736388 RepID=UPI000700C58F|nr:ABC-2 family transporter protein [Paenibacillus sp. Soil522]KRE21102.1 hypothetical protein ASG81_29500 [Paenibacillus sp. Soil522]
MVVAAALTQLLGIVFLWAVYSRIPDINGWLFWEVVFIYATIFMSEGFASLFFDGTWRLSGLVNRGDFDTFLLTVRSFFACFNRPFILHSIPTDSAQ